MLETDFSAGLEEPLEVLIVVVLIVLAAKDEAHQLEIGDAAFGFKLADVFEFAEAAGNGAGGQGFAVQCGDDSNHVRDFAAFAGRPGRNTRDIELPVFKAEGAEVQLAAAGEPAVLIGHRQAEDLRLGDDQKSHRVNWRQGAGRKNRPLNTLFAVLQNEGTKVSEVAESRIVPG